jgi:hypothetical protein
VKKKKPHKKVIRKLLEPGLYNVRQSFVSTSPIIAKIDSIEMRGHGRDVYHGRVCWYENGFVKSHVAEWSSNVRIDSDHLARCIEFDGKYVNVGFLTPNDIVSKFSGLLPIGFFDTEKPNRKMLKNGLYHVRDSACNGMPIVAEITGNDGVLMCGKVYWWSGHITKTANAAWSADVQSDTDVIAKCKQFGSSTKEATVFGYDLTEEYKSDRPSKWFSEEKEKSPFPVTVGLWQSHDGDTWEVTHVGVDKCIGHSPDGSFVHCWKIKSGWCLDTNNQNHFLVRKLSPEVKKEKRLRPWKPEEVPLNAVFRKKNTSKYCVCTYSEINESFVIIAGYIFRHADLFDSHEHSTDGGKTWNRCGVEEEA